MPDYVLEQAAIADGFMTIAGIDEVGRGPWAGPVVAGAAILEIDRIPNDLLDALDDSKKLKPARRTEIYQRLKVESGVLLGIGMASVDEIDELNILQATMVAMRRAVINLPQVPSLALVDGNKPPELSCPVRCVIRGDATSLSIAAASIAAKVTRDAIMAELDQKFPGYGWRTNAGYGTAQHQDALKRLGVTIHHRRSYKPIRVALEASPDVESG